MRKLILLALVCALVVPASASAHTLSASRVRGITASVAYDVYLEIDTATGSGVGKCQRLSLHAVRCVGYIEYDDGEYVGYCNWWTHVRFRSSRSRAIKVSTYDVEC